MLDKHWNNNSICRIIENDKENKINNDISNENIEDNIKENTFEIIMNIDKLKEYIINNNINIELPIQNYKYLIIQLDSKINEEKLLKKILTFYTKKYNIDMKEIYILYIPSEIDMKFIYKIICILNYPYILITNSKIIEHLNIDNLIQKRGDFISINDEKTKIMYTLSLSLILKNPTYINILNKDINNFFK